MSKKNHEGRMGMTNERLNQRLAAYIRLKELYRIKGHQHLLYGAANDLNDSEIHRLENELRRIRGGESLESIGRSY